MAESGRQPAGTGTWFPYRKPTGDLEVFAFGHAGAGSMVFQPLRDALEGSGLSLVPAVLPGRERRLREPPHERMDGLLAAFEEAARADGFSAFTGDYALLGHCSGALVAFELARILQRSPCRPPRLLVACSCLPPPRVADTGTGRLPSGELFARTSGLGGTPASLLDNPDFRSVVERALRADWRVYDGYEYRPGEPLSAPILALRGAHDPDLSVEDLARWQDETSAPGRTASLDVGHWLLAGAGYSALAREIPAALAGLRDGGHRAPA